MQHQTYEILESWKSAATAAASAAAAAAAATNAADFHRGSTD